MIALLLSIFGAASQSSDLRVGASEQTILARFGTPDQRIVASKRVVFDPKVAEVWEYGARRASSFPWKGTLYFDKGGNLVRLFGFRDPNSPTTDEVQALDALDQSPVLIGSDFDPKKALFAADMMFKLGKGGVIRLARRYLSTRPLSPYLDERFTMPAYSQSVRDLEDYRLAVVLWILFPVSINPHMPKSHILFGSPLGLPGQVGNPLFISEGTPIVLTNVLLGHDDGYLPKLLNYCDKNGQMVQRAPSSAGNRVQTGRTLKSFLKQFPRSNEAGFSEIIKAQFDRAFDTKT